jgi:hypothetical protein
VIRPEGALVTKRYQLMATKTKNTRTTKSRKRPTKSRRGMTIIEALDAHGVKAAAAAAKTEKPISEMTNAEIAIGAMRLAGRSEAHIAEQLRSEAQRYMDAARTLAPETPLPDGLVERAASRAGISIPPHLPSPDPYELAMKHVAGRIGGLIVKACDELGEEIASYTEAGGDDYNVRQALRSLWQARWELGISRVDGEAARFWVEDNARRVRQENEPAKVAS